MIILVDAYNLLRAVPPYKKTITDKERKQFIAQLSVYGRRKGHKIIIVFDGGPHEWPFKENMKIVQIVYSGIHESADDYIKEYIETNKAKDLLLVSSDSELNRHAEHLKIPSIDSSSFYELLRDEMVSYQFSSSPKKQEYYVKMIDDEQDIDDFMVQASRNIPTKSEDFIAHKKQVLKQDQLSKQERKLLKKLKKL